MNKYAIPFVYYCIDNRGNEEVPSAFIIEAKNKEHCLKLAKEYVRRYDQAIDPEEESTISIGFPALDEDTDDEGYVIGEPVLIN